ncbi:MAG: abortive infection system antitoxin AbiGi family protein [Magnetococcus sp. DMHC-8]
MLETRDMSGAKHNRPDFSNLVAHFTKEGQPCVSDQKEGDPTKGKTSAYDRLIQILTDKKINASTMPWTIKQAVCFTECPFWSLVHHANVYSPYCVGFTKAHLFAAGGGPAIYLRWDLLKKQKEFVHNKNSKITGFHHDIYSFVTPFAPDYASRHFKQNHFPGGKQCDYSQEREWRVPSDFAFELTEVQFIILESYKDMAKFPTHLKDGVGREKFILLDNHSKIESLWPNHIQP